MHKEVISTKIHWRNARILRGELKMRKTKNCPPKTKEPGRFPDTKENN